MCYLIKVTSYKVAQISKQNSYYGVQCRECQYEIMW
nr:MAG TPA: hypothetical protein [Caudoviricetes sp.]